jgi:hypothetical protein
LREFREFGELGEWGELSRQSAVGSKQKVKCKMKNAK